MVVMDRVKASFAIPIEIPDETRQASMWRLSNWIRAFMLFVFAARVERR